MSEPVRVAQILNRMDSGGIESVVMNYYRHIDRKKIQFDIYFSQDSTYPQREELERLGEICRKYDVIVVSDEIHEDFVYEGKHQVFADIKKEYLDFTIT